MLMKICENLGRHIYFFFFIYFFLSFSSVDLCDPSETVQKSGIKVQSLKKYPQQKCPFSYFLLLEEK